MSDPVLAAHKVGERRYELSGLRTTSIRDQMNRACLIVARLRQEKEIGPSPQNGLLIVGAGAGGVTAAIKAAECGIRAVIIEQHHHPFSTQRMSQRLIDPNEYDWPASHWDDSNFPAAAHGVFPRPPLPWRVQQADKLAAQWDLGLRAFLAKSVPPPPIEVRYGVKADKAQIVTVELPVPHVEYRRSGVTTESFGAALSFVGFPREKCSIGGGAGNGGYSSIEFWGPDPFGRLKSAGTQRTRVIVSGAGDGGLQDFVRALVPGKTVGQVLRQFHDVVGSCSVPPLLIAEEEAQRACLWSETGNDCDVMRRWHRAFLDVVDSIWSTVGQSQLEAFAKGIGLERDRDVRLVHSCDHFSYCYPLNRITALVLARTYEELNTAGVTRAFIANHRVTRVAGVRHPCSGARSCVGKQHEVLLQSSACRGSSKNPHPPLIGDVVIVRHGVERDPFFGAPPVARQLLPYHLL